MLPGVENLNTTTFFFLFLVLALAVAIDIEERRIPNVVLAPAIVVALMLQTTSGGVDGFLTAIIGLLFGIAMLLPMYVIGGMGAGDVKLLGVVGSFVGPWGAIVAGIATMMAGAVFGIMFIVWRRVQPPAGQTFARIVFPADSSISRMPIPSTSITTLRENRSTGIPYAPAIAVGTAASLWYLDILPRQILG
jgi:prepilin peptidase CpaA